MVQCCLLKITAFFACGYDELNKETENGVRVKFNQNIVEFVQNCRLVIFYTYLQTFRDNAW